MDTRTGQIVAVKQIKHILECDVKARSVLREVQIMRHLAEMEPDKDKRLLKDIVLYSIDDKT